MALPGLVRVTVVARLLGVAPGTAANWCRRLGIPIAIAPVRGMPVTYKAKTHSGGPLYISVEQAATLIDALMPGLANLSERRSTYKKVRLAAKAARVSSRNVRNEVIWKS